MNVELAIPLSKHCHLIRNVPLFCHGLLEGQSNHLQCTEWLDFYYFCDFKLSKEHATLLVLCNDFCKVIFSLSPADRKTFDMSRKMIKIKILLKIPESERISFIIT